MQAAESFYADLDELFSMLSEDVANYLKLEKYNAIFEKSFSLGSTTNECYDSFWPHFLRILCYIPFPDDSRFRLTTLLKTYYHGNDSELKFLSEFERDYLPEKAICWYTRPSLLFNILNRALRQHNRAVMIFFGFLIKDIYLQLKNQFQEQLNLFTDIECFKVYRGQGISKRELDARQCTDNYYGITTNSFFSTTFNRQLALLYLNSSSQINHYRQNILFEIEIDIRKTQNCVHPFASVAHLSSVPGEEELLFMPGTRFIEHGIIFDQTENIWLIKMSLAPDTSQSGKLLV